MVLILILIVFVVFVSSHSIEVGGKLVCYAEKDIEHPPPPPCDQEPTLLAVHMLKKYIPKLSMFTYKSKILKQALIKLQPPPWSEKNINPPPYF